MVTGPGHRSYLLISGFRVTLHRNCCYPSLSLYSLTLIRPYKPPITVSRLLSSMSGLLLGDRVQPCRCQAQCHPRCSPDPEARPGWQWQSWPRATLASPVIIVPMQGERRCLAPDLGLHSKHTQTHLQTSSNFTFSVALVSWISGGGM